MKANEAYEALIPTLDDIAKILKDAGIEAKTKCSFSDVDLNDRTAESDMATGLYGEIIFSVDDDCAALECAVSVYDKEVSDEELLFEITTIRNEARRIAGIANEVGKDKLFQALCDEDEKEDSNADKPSDFEKLEFESLLASVEKREAENDRDILSFADRVKSLSPMPFIIGGVALAVIIAALIFLL